MSGNYYDFDFEIRRIPTGHVGRVLDSPGGEARDEFVLPFSEREIESLLHGARRLSAAAHRDLMPRVKGDEVTADEGVQAFGARLFDAVFDGELRECLRMSLQKAKAKDRGLRFRLRLGEAPELAPLPWEFLYDSKRKDFLFLSSLTPLVRYFELTVPPEALVVEPPLRVLAMISDPQGAARLDVEEEWRKLNSALASLIERRLITLERESNATLGALRKRMRQPFHVFHFIGHGGFDSHASTGTLLFEDNHGLGQEVTSEKLWTSLKDNRALRLVVLNACEGARSGESNPVGGVAQGLVNRGVPAVIAMQFPITDSAAISFASTFYDALASDRLPVDAALGEARKELHSAGGIEWGTPVLFMRSPDGRLFDWDAVDGQTASVPPDDSRDGTGEAPSTVRPNNLPAILTSFVGRHSEVAEIRSLVVDHRIVSLVGPGGCGKTRLAAAVAEGLAAAEGDLFADGIWWVDAAYAGDGDELRQAVAAALGVREAAAADLHSALVAHLRPRNLLLVIDNCEHLIALAADLGTKLLAACPSVHVLATSREALGVPGEKVWLVPPLSLPPAKGTIAAARALTSEAVQLFEERAALARHGFKVEDANAKAVTEICRQVDGIPLAIELAAARVRSLEPAQIAARLNDMFRLLRSDDRAVLPRHQTLLAVIESSYVVLTPAERALFDRLAVFAGTFSLEAAEAVAATSAAGGTRSTHAGAPAGSEVPVEIRPDDVLDLITSLADQSMVSVQPLGNEVRYRLLETLKRYAHDRLTERGTVDAAQRSHAIHFAGLAESLARSYRTDQEEAAIRRLTLDNDNFHAVFAWATRRADDAEGDYGAKLALRLGAALAQYWEHLGQLYTGRRVMSAILALPGAAEPTALRATALRGVGKLAEEQGDYSVAAAYYEESISIARRLDDERAVGECLIVLGNVANLQARYGEARERYDEALALWRRLGDPWMVARALNNLGNVNNYVADYDAARACYSEALDLFRRVGHRWAVGTALNNLGLVALQVGDYHDARKLIEESIEIAHEMGSLPLEAYALHNLGDVAIAERDLTQAHVLQAACLRMRRDLGDRQGIAASLESYATLARVEDDPAWAVTLLAVAGTLREVIGAPRPADEAAELAQEIAALRATLGESAYDAAWEAGRSLDVDTAVTQVLEEVPGSREREAMLG